MENKSEYYNVTHLRMDEFFKGANGMSDVGDIDSNQSAKLQPQITSTKALDRKCTRPPAAEGKIFQGCPGTEGDEVQPEVLPVV